MISVIAERCSGCRICELVCSHTKLQTFSPKTACIKVVDLDYWGFSNPVVCIQCKKPRCLEICPTEALSQTELGTIVVDEEKCNGCGDCVVECPVGAINFDEERGLPMICDLCGGSPVCVEWCPSGAVIFKSGSEKPQKGKGKRELSQAISKGKRSLSKFNIPQYVSDWYDQFVL